MEAVGSMLGDFVDDYTVKVADVSQSAIESAERQSIWRSNTKCSNRKEGDASALLCSQVARS